MNEIEKAIEDLNNYLNFVQFGDIDDETARIAIDALKLKDAVNKVCDCYIMPNDMVIFDNVNVREAIDKQRPQKPVDNHHCPNCGTGLNVAHITNEWCRCCFYPKFCHRCGQAIDWGD